MASDAISLLNKRIGYFLKEILGWHNLNPIQEKTIPEIIKGRDTLVIAPTASGKTEAVLIPIFNQIITNSYEPTSVLYISPLKALINDMYYRIDNWGDYFNLTTTKWHGDVSTSKRNNYIKNPTDFLLITPESLEVIFMNKKESEKKQIFKNIKYIIIDEIHNFAEDDRGIQLNSLLNRIEHYTINKPVRVGLSATVGNPKTVAKWINHENPAKIVKTGENQQFQYKVWERTDKPSSLNRLKKYQYKKILIFVSKRKTAESYYKHLEELGFKNIFIHHSSISTNQREKDEKEFKDAEYGIMISTSTLELGIDIGNIYVVIQIEPPNNISSFLQRIGRAGRKTGNRKTIIYTNTEGTLITLAELLLIQENKIENIKIPTRSKDILFHQILSTLKEKGKMKISDLYYHLVNCYVFSDITKDEYKELLKYMISEDFVSNYHNTLSTGYKFEKEFGKFNFMDFYSVFFTNDEFTVKEGKKEIGTLNFIYISVLSKGTTFLLGGKSWVLKDVNYKKQTINVVKDKSNRKDLPTWINNIPFLSYTITRKVYEILSKDFDENALKYFDDSLVQLIHKVKDYAQLNDFIEGVIPVEINRKKNRIYIYTFAGQRANLLLLSVFQFYYDIITLDFKNPFYCTFKYKNDVTFQEIESIIYNIENTLKSDEYKIEIQEFISKFNKNKYTKYLPLEDELELKMNLLFDKDNLLKLLNDNTLMEVHNSNFNKWFKGRDNKNQEIKLR